MSRTIASLFAAAALVLPLALAGCATPPAQQNFADLSYRHLAPINLAVSSFDVETRYIPPLKAPNVEHLAPVKPYNAARQWGFDRIKTRGGDARARLVVLDASIIEVPLAVTGGIKGAFTRDQAARYDGKLAVMLEVIDAGGVQRAYVTARADRSQTVPEGATIAERDRVWFAITEDMMRQLNEQLERNIASYFGTYLKRD